MKTKNELIKLKGRGSHAYIERVAPNLYEMLFGEYMSITYDGCDNGIFNGIHSVDPPGGPFMCLGSKTPWNGQETIISIKHEHRVAIGNTGKVNEMDFIIISTDCEVSKN